MKVRSSSISSVILAFALLGSVAIAQGPPRGPMHDGGFFGEHMLGFFADVLDLSDAQQAQIKQIMESTRPTIEPLFRQEMQNKKAMMQLITGGNFDEAKAQSLAQQCATVHAQIEVAHARAASQAFQVLTAEQKTKLNEFMARREQRMQQHMQEHMHGQMPPPPDSE